MWHQTRCVALRMQESFIEKLLLLRQAASCSRGKEPSVAGAAFVYVGFVGLVCLRVQHGRPGYTYKAWAQEAADAASEAMKTARNAELAAGQASLTQEQVDIQVSCLCSTARQGVSSTSQNLPGMPLKMR
eukprot:symbB.v1.2.028652.t1/scaffold3058.1/size64496/2